MQTDASRNILTETVPLPFPLKQSTLQSLAGTDTLNIVETGVSGNIVATLDARQLDTSNMAGQIIYSQSPSTIENLNIDFGSGGDTVEVLETNVNTVTNVYTGGGRDMVRVGDADASLDEIQGTLNIDAGGGSNVLVVDGSGDSTADLAVEITKNSVIGLAPAEIHYTATDGDFQSQFDASTGSFSAGVTISAGSGDDGLQIKDTLNNPGRIEVTLVQAGVAMTGSKSSIAISVIWWSAGRMATTPSTPKRRRPVWQYSVGADRD